MRKQTTDNVLKKTFEHLDKILDEQKRKADKRKEGHHSQSRPFENDKNKRGVSPG